MLKMVFSVFIKWTVNFSTNYFVFCFIVFFIKVSLCVMLADFFMVVAVSKILRD